MDKWDFLHSLGLPSKRSAVTIIGFQAVLYYRYHSIYRPILWMDWSLADSFSH